MRPEVNSCISEASASGKGHRVANFHTTSTGLILTDHEKIVLRPGHDGVSNEENSLGAVIAQPPARVVRRAVSGRGLDST